MNVCSTIASHKGSILNNPFKLQALTRLQLRNYIQLLKISHLCLLTMSPVPSWPRWTLPHVHTSVLIARAPRARMEASLSVSTRSEASLHGPLHDHSHLDPQATNKLISQSSVSLKYTDINISNTQLYNCYTMSVLLRTDSFIIISSQWKTLYKKTKLRTTKNI